ncbi:MAG TPA: hypothetical protein EYH51_16190, partial [Pseudomonas pachastrellae]|nr:hypothetical protein [Halopseudomonas pachastrellae]
MSRVHLAVVLLLGITSVHATPNDDTDLAPWAVETITPVHDRVTRWVDSTARNLDGFFGTLDSDQVENESYLRLSSDFDWMESEDFEIDPGIRFKLDLPTTRERLRLIIESDPEESRGTLEEQGAEPLRPQDDSLSNTVIGLAGLGNNDPTVGWKTRAGAGVKVRWPLNPYARASAERLWQLG